MKILVFPSATNSMLIYFGFPSLHGDITLEIPLKCWVFFVLNLDCLFLNLNWFNYNYFRKDIQCLIIFNVVTALPCSTLIFNSLTVSVRHKCVVAFPTATSLHVKHGIHQTCDFRVGTPPSYSMISLLVSLFFFHYFFSYCY